MKSFISEDDIEQAILQMLESPEFGYGVVRCDPSPEKMEVLPDGTGRSSKKQCVLPVILRESLTRLNPEIPANKLDEIAQDLVRDYSGTDMTQLRTLQENSRRCARPVCQGRQARFWRRVAY